MTRSEKEKARLKEIRRRRQNRAAITHRNGKPLLTKELIRDLKEYVNPLEQLILILTNCFPWLLEELGNLSDTRNASYTTYEMQEITLIRLLALCCGIKSMAGIMTKLNKVDFIKNINQILKTELKKFPCDDAISNVMNQLKEEELEKIQKRIIRRLIESKTLDQFRLFNASFYVVIDGTGLYSTRKDLGDDCIYKVRNKGTDEEYTEYHYYVLEAKLVCGDYVFSFATEFVNNAHMNSEAEKQDCELKAAHRLLQKIRKNFPKLAITIGADALYVNKPFMDLCKELKMDYILRYKDTVMSTIAEEYEQIEKTVNGNYEYVNDLGYGSGTKNSEGKLNIIRYKGPSDMESDESKKPKQIDMMFVTSLTINSGNNKEIVLSGRRRWKIENAGFKDQKSEVLNIEHRYTYNSNGTKAHYYFIQIAHVLLTILNYGSSIIKKLKETKIEISNLLYLALIRYEEIDMSRVIQIRFE